MDYLEDLSLVDDDNDDKKLLWKSNTNDSNTNDNSATDAVNINEAVLVTDSIIDDDIDSSVTQPVVLTEKDTTEVAVVSADTSDSLSVVLTEKDTTEVAVVSADVSDISADVSAVASDINADISADVSDVADAMIATIEGKSNDDFTHEVVIPNDDHDDEDIDQALVVPVQQYIELATDNNFNVSSDANNIIDTNDVLIEDITAVSTDIADIYDTCISIGNDMAKSVSVCDDNYVDVDTIIDNNTNIVEVITVDSDLIIDTMAIVVDNDNSDIKNESNIETIEVVADNINDTNLNIIEYKDSEECKETIDNETIETIETKAFIRLNVRFEQARWKYQWELVSYYAALQARNKYKMTYL